MAQEAVAVADVAEPATATVASPQARTRLLVRTGSVRIATTTIDSALDRAEALALKLGGFTDRRDLQSVVLRVPVARFDEAFARLQLLGRVLDHSRSAQDVTAEFQDVQLQIRIQRRLLDKLQEILGQETSLDRRKALLQEIQATSERLERLERRGEILRKQAAFSTLVLQCERPLVRGTTGADHRDLAVFRWVRDLQPRALDDAPTVGERLELGVPEGMVALPHRTSRHEWRSVSPEGCEFRARRIPNQPAGDASFWREALRLRLAPSFRTADTLALGTWQVLRLQSPDPRAWSWWLAVRVHDDELHLAQAFCPDSSLERRQRPAFERILRQETP